MHIHAYTYMHLFIHPRMDRCIHVHVVDLQRANDTLYTAHGVGGEHNSAADEDDVITVMYKQQQ